MHIRQTVFNGRQGWELDNDALSLVMLKGGGHIASIRLKVRGAVNPLWTPVWKTIEPWDYRPGHAARYESRLLASICGHNPCLGWFGGPSPDEARQGLPCHGEAPVARWRLIGGKATARSVQLTCGCVLPVAQMRYTRTLHSRRGANLVEVCERIENLSRRDLPFTMSQHVTVGPPFLEKGVTAFDMPAAAGHTFPKPFGRPQRLKTDTAFMWPNGPGANGKPVDLRVIGRQYRRSSDFTTQLMDPGREDAWFSAVNPRLGLLFAGVWRRSDFPWLGNWEENYGRRQPPWAGRSLTRGMEFANTPFPVGLREAVNLGAFHGRPTFRWLPARGRVEIDYCLILTQVPLQVSGVANIRPCETGFEIDLKTDAARA